MKNLVVTIAVLAITFGAKAQTGFQFLSAQHQQIKFDTTFNAYFIENEVSAVSRIEVQDNIIYFSSHAEVKPSKVVLSKDKMQYINNKESFSVVAEDGEGLTVKVAFWFIDGGLEEVSYTDAAKVTTAFKNITINPEDISKRTTRPQQNRL